ncbi:MAG TPA: hypothetical protein DCZ01_03925 [Elusimicrobia bacterium]|nr:MAG: hypothetical protein A2X37_07825 [Elusimicrobia bacterium GWA2_66_18]OGR70553.1 MAG: hypothetical protein A2X40_04700 [Elusimicrobia bacterium GWC2_65_9]HAZ07675.1 hypothetical protein [Elusimicrobiota bacterium]
MRSGLLRWALLLAALAVVARCLVSGMTPGRVIFGAACASAWYILSRRKVYSLDRDHLGLPPRD